MTAEDAIVLGVKQAMAMDYLPGVGKEVLAALDAAGLVVVPVEPTEKMMKAVLAACWPVNEAREDTFIDVAAALEWLTPVVRAALRAPA